MKKYSKLLILTIIILSGFCYVSAILAAETSDTEGYELQIPIFDYSHSQNIAEYILRIYQYALIVLVPLTIIMIIIGGILWISSAGNTGQIQKAKGQITSASIGLLIALCSFILLRLVGITELNLPGLDMIARLEGYALEFSAEAPDTIGGGDVCLGKTTYGTNEECKAKETACAGKNCTMGAENKYCCIDKPAKAIYVHWSGGNPATNAPAYNYAVTIDGVIHKNYDENERSPKCTWHRNQKGNMCVSAMGAHADWARNNAECFHNSSLKGEKCNHPEFQFSDVQITAVLGKIQELKTKYNIPALTHGQAAIQDGYHCIVNPNPAVLRARGGFGCRWDWYPHDAEMN